MFEKVLAYAGPYRRGIVLATMLILLSTLCGVLPFVWAYQIIAPLLAGDALSAPAVFGRVVGVLACLVAQAVLYARGLTLSHHAAYGTLLELRRALQTKLEGLPLGVVEEKGTGALKKLFVDDVDSLELLLAHSLPEGLGNLMVPVAVILTLFLVDWKLALLSLATIPLSLVAMQRMFSAGNSRMGNYYQSAKRMNNTIIEYVNGMEAVKVFNRDAESYARLTGDILTYRDNTLAWYKACWPWMSVYNCLLPCTIILTLPLGSWFVLQGWSTLSDLVLVLCLDFSIGTPLLKTMGFLPTLPHLNYKIAALEQVLDAPPLIQNDASFCGSDNSVNFSHVSFGYGDKEVLHDISFTARAGQKTAIVGESGSGKSTLAKLLIHYYDVKDGSVSIGGTDIRQMSLAALNDRIAYVAQDQYLFNTSLLENIRLGRPDATDADVFAAAERAQCTAFFERLPQGAHTMAGDAGKMLSGGQRQRIAFARAILKDAPIILLDEATAYADPENEDKMEAAIAELVRRPSPSGPASRRKTLIVIAHKLPAVMDADQIVVLERGRIVGTGTHTALLQDCPEYQRLWQAAQQSVDWQIHSGKENA